MVKLEPKNPYIELCDKKILLAEDNPINQLVTKDLLEDVGAIVTVASNGKIALELLNQSEFDLILMDMQMPVLDGYQAMKSIRESNNKIKNIPILALTANAINTEVEKCFEFGANEYLSKPFKPDSLYEKMVLLVDNKQSKNQLKETTTEMEKIDLKTLDMFTNGKVELLNSTLEQLSISFQEDLSLLQNTLNKKDYLQIKLIAHRIKPNFLMIGFNKLGILCKEIESTDHVELIVLKCKQLIEKIPFVINELSEVNPKIST